MIIASMERGENLSICNLFLTTTEALRALFITLGTSLYENR